MFIMPDQKNDNGFHVRMDGVRLSDASKNRIQAGIQKVIMDELAGYYPNPDDDGKSHTGNFGGPVIVVPPKWWWGFILRQLVPNEIDSIKGLKDVINGKEYGQQH